jgi:hypothetical protein
MPTQVRGVYASEPDSVAHSALFYGRPILPFCGTEELLEEALEGMPHIVAADVESARKASKRMQAGLLVSGAKVDLVPYLREHVERYHAWMQVKMRADVMGHMFPAFHRAWERQIFTAFVQSTCSTRHMSPAFWRKSKGKYSSMPCSGLRCNFDRMRS